MVLSGGTMVHGLPKRPVTVMPPARPVATSSSSSTRSQLPATHSQHPPQQPQAPHPTITPPLDASSNVLLSQIALPERPIICYRQFGPVDGVHDHHLAVELVRRTLVHDWEAQGILDTWLAIVRVDKQSISLWVFTVISDDGTSTSALDRLQLDEMHSMRSGRFSPRDLYPCSAECTQPTKGCANCGQERPLIHNSLPTFCLLPRSGLRIPYATFLDAVRGRLIDKVSQLQRRPTLEDDDAPIMRLNDGFLLGHKMYGEAWEKSWHSDFQQRPTSTPIHCAFHLSLLPTKILVQPTFKKAPLVSLSPLPSAGTPVVLLPYGTPAYYIGPYIGPKEEPLRSFQESLRGLGCRNWEDQGMVVCWITVRTGSSHPPPTTPTPSAAFATKSQPIQERGSMVIWPMALCFVSIVSSRKPLASLPSLPPSVCQPISPPRASATQAATDPPAPSQSVATAPNDFTAQSAPSKLGPTASERVSHTRASSLSGIKALSIDATTVAYGPGAGTVAVEMGGYVEWVVKERERDKERLAKEKEKEKEKSRKDVERPPHLTSDPRSFDPRLSWSQHASTSSRSADSPLLALPPPTSSHLRAQGSAANPQGYYPSPPEFNSPAAPAAGPSRLAVLTAPAPEMHGAANQQDMMQHDWDMMDASGVFNMNDDLNMSAHSNNVPLTSRSSAFDVDMSVINMARMAMATEDVFTEDDFDFFDGPKQPPPPPPQASGALTSGNLPFTTPLTQPDNLASSWMDEFLGGSSSLSRLPSTSVSLPMPSSADLTLSQNPAIIGSSSDNTQHLSLNLPAPRTPQSHDFQQLPHSTLLLSPARTPVSSSSSLPSPSSSLASSDETSDRPDQEEEVPAPPEEPTLPPAFSHSTKEFVSNQYAPIPFPASLALADRKYIPRFDRTPSPSPSPNDEEDDPEAETLAQATNEFIKTAELQTLFLPKSSRLRGTTTQRRLLYHTPYHNLETEVERYRRMNRARLRDTVTKPPRHGKFEIWHSRKFVHVFASNTDPRVKQVQRLRGAKRTVEFTPYRYLKWEGDGNLRNKGLKASEFVDLHPTPEHEGPLESDSDGESSAFGTDLEAVENGDDVVGDGGSVIHITEADDEPLSAVSEGPREPKTPPPPTLSSVAMGASLLHTLCNPHHVLAMSNGTTFNTVAKAPSPAHIPMSVPTPVSPAAHATPSGESAVLLEAATHVLVRELVENPAWASAYQDSFGCGESNLVNASIVDSVADLLKVMPDVQYQSTLQQLAQLDAPPSHASDKKATLMQIIKSPMFAVGRAGAVMHMGATSLRFWDKLGLYPVNGPKDVMAFVMYEENLSTPDHVAFLSDWLDSVGRVYSDRHLGSHTVSDVSAEHPNGLVPFKWESVKKTIGNLVSILPTDPSNIVIYIVTTPPMSSTTYREFRQLSGALMRIHSAIPGLDDHISFHFVSKALVYDARSVSQTGRQGMENFVQSVYDRLLYRVERIIPRPFFKRPSLKSYKFLQSHAFTLARKPSRFSFLLVDWPPASTNVVDRHSVLHVAYQISQCANFVLMCAVDEHGEAHDVRAALIGGDELDASETGDKVVSSVMTFVLDFCSQTNTEWSVVVARSGAMFEQELTAWEKCLEREVLNQDQAIYMIIACVEYTFPFPFLAPSPTSNKNSSLVPHPTNHSKWSYADMSFTNLTLSPYYRTPLIGSSTKNFGPDFLTMEEDLTITYNPSIPYGSTLPLLPLHSSYLLSSPPCGDRATGATLGSAEFATVITSLQFNILHTCRSSSSSVRKPAYDQQEDILRTYCSLAVLARERWATSKYGCIPFHIAAVEIMKKALMYSKES